MKPRLIATPKGVMNLRQAAAAFGIPYNTLLSRLHRDWDIKKALLQSRVRSPTKVKIPTEAGELTIGEIAERLGITYGIAHARYRRGRGRPDRGRQIRYLTPWGVLTVFSIAKRMGIAQTSLVARVYGYNGAWTLEQAFNTPPYGKRGQHFIMPPEEYRRRCEQVARKDKRDSLLQPSLLRASTTEVELQRAQL